MKYKYRTLLLAHYKNMRHISTYLDDILIEDEELYDEEYLDLYGRKQFLKGMLATFMIALAAKLILSIPIPQPFAYDNEGNIYVCSPTGQCILTK